MGLLFQFVAPNHVRNNSLFKPSIVATNPRNNNCDKNEEAQSEEKPEEVLDIVAKVTTIVFLVPLQSNT